MAFPQKGTGNVSTRPSAVNIGAILSFNSTEVAIQAAVDDVNSNATILSGTKLNISMLDTKLSTGFLGIIASTDPTLTSMQFPYFVRLGYWSETSGLHTEEASIHSNCSEGLNVIWPDVFTAALNLLPYPIPFNFIPFGHGKTNPSNSDFLHMVTIGLRCCGGGPRKDSGFFTVIYRASCCGTYQEVEIIHSNDVFCDRNVLLALI
ncbi:hypothetical protein VNO80_20787 [Phaseolus coccineus]|uniref:Receptor ligand binding region domain-containing protein n=1 Tax=Phaseolus coccineus TaxID=3886 RepID=A0AAN9M1W1_PHACN